MAKTAEEMMQAMKDGILDKTGHDLDHWVTLVKSSGLTKHSEQMTLLKSDHGLTHGYANFICQAAKGRLEAKDDDLLEGQYQGKDSLRPIYSVLESAARKLGSDVEISPKKTSVAFRRNKNFAVVTPATKSRVDLGLNLKGMEPSDRLLAEKPNAMCTHKVSLTTPDEVDETVLDWLSQAYDQA